MTLTDDFFSDTLHCIALLHLIDNIVLSMLKTGQRNVSFKVNINVISWVRVATLKAKNPFNQWFWFCHQLE